MASTAVKRIMCEVMELQSESEKPDAFFKAAPLDDDLFEWHFTVRGPPDTPFEGGAYHGRILLPPEYPYKAPEILILTPNGRFEVGTRICLSITSHHQETWQPSWGIRTMITALVGYMPSAEQGIGSLDYPAEERKRLARKSLGFKCNRCGVSCGDLFPPPAVKSDDMSASASTATASASARGASPTGGDAAASSAAEDDAAASGFEDSDAAESDAEDSGERLAVVEETDDATVAAQERGPTGAVDEVPQEGQATIPPAAAAVPAEGRDGVEVVGAERMAPVSQPVQEKELLYLAMALGVILVGLVLRRLLSTSNVYEFDL